MCGWNSSSPDLDFYFFWHRRCSGILLSVEWKFRTDVSGQPIGSIVQDRGVQEEEVTTWPLKMERAGCPETLAQNYQSTLRNIPEERRVRLHPDRNLKSRTLLFYCLRLWTLMYSMRVFENSAKENIWNSGSNLYCRDVIICNFHVVLVPNPAETE
jgi:hypothetical protein